MPYEVVLIGVPSADEIRDISQLVAQLSKTASSPNLATIEAIASNPLSHLIVATSGDIVVGCATLTLILGLTGLRAHLDDVVVDATHRRQGLGERLVQFALNLAEQHDVRSVDLTSRPERVEAHRLYLKMGFKPRDTTSYRWTPAT